MNKDNEKTSAGVASASATAASTELARSRNDTSPTAVATRRAATLAAINDSDEEYASLVASLSPAKRNKLSRRLDSLQYSVALTAPITCLGPNKCPFFHLCPIGDGVNSDGSPLYSPTDQFPIGNHCILEKIYVEQRLSNYMEEFAVDPNMISEMTLINDLITIDLQKQRALAILSIGDKKGFGRDFTAISYSYSDKEATSGEVTAEELKEHPLMARIDSLDKKRISILDQLNATRKAKAAVAKTFAEVATSNKMLDDLSTIKNVIAAMSKKDSSSEPFTDADFIAID